MGVILRVLKVGEKRYSIYKLLPEYVVEEVQDLMNFALENKSEIHLAYVAGGIEATLTFFPHECLRIEASPMEEYEQEDYDEDEEC